MDGDIAEFSTQKVVSCATAPHELLVRILKLRWMGMDEEAERMAASLGRIDPPCVLPPALADTD